MKTKSLLLLLYCCCTSRDLEVSFSNVNLLIQNEITVDEKIRVINKSPKQIKFLITCAYCYNDYIETKVSGSWKSAEFEKYGKKIESKRPIGVLGKSQKIFSPNDTLLLRSLTDRGKILNLKDSIRVVIYGQINNVKYRMISNSIVVKN